MRLRLWAGIAVAVAIAVGSPIAGGIVHLEDRADHERRQDEAALRSARQVEALAFLAIGQLNAAAALYQVEEDLKRRQFRALAGSLLRQGALTGTGFVAAEGRCCRLAHVASPLGATAEPGFDLGANPDHAQALRRARDTATATITPVGRTLIAPGPGLVVYAPVYRQGAPLASVAQRRAALRGYAAGAFPVEGFGTAARAAVPDHVEVQVLQRGEAVVGPAEELSEGSRATIRIGGRNWIMVVHDPHGPQVGVPILIGVLGISLASLLAALLLTWSRNEQMRELQRQATHDSLTGLKNRRRFDEDLRRELALSRRERSEGAVMMVDLDNFKQVNDTLGHQIGDRVIEEIADVLRRRTRETDVLARLGGDEFALVLPRCDPAEARGVAEQILTSIRENAPPGDGVPAITACIGIAMFGPDDSAAFDSVQASADAAMYEAKRAGRDSVRLSAQPVRAGA